MSTERGAAFGPSPDSSRPKPIKDQVVDVLERQFPEGMTNAEIEPNLEGRTKGWWNCLSDLRRAGVIVSMGKVGKDNPERGGPGSNIWRYVPVSMRVPVQEPVTRAEITLDTLINRRDVRREIRELLRENRDQVKLATTVEKLMRTAERIEVARIEKEWAEAQLRAEAWALRGRPWDGLVERIDAQNKILGQALALLNDAVLPPMTTIRELDRQLDALEKMLNIMNERLSRRQVGKGEVIDVIDID